MTINKQEWSAFNCYRLRLCQPRTHTIRFVPHAGKANQTETKIRQKLPLSERERKRAAAKVKEKRGKKCLDKSLEINQIKISENEKRQINGSEMHKPYRFFFSLSLHWLWFHHHPLEKKKPIALRTNIWCSNMRNTFATENQNTIIIRRSCSAVRPVEHRQRVWRRCVVAPKQIYIIGFRIFSCQWNNSHRCELATIPFSYLFSA